MSAVDRIGREMRGASIPDSKSYEARKAARLAAAKARRETAPAYETVETTVGELRLGDYLVVVPTQDGIRGTRFDGLLGRKTVTWDAYRLTGPSHPRRGTPVEAFVLGTKLVDGAVAYPSSFRCTVRRPVESAS